MFTDKKVRLKEIFEDTQRFYTENKMLSEAVSYSKAHTKLYRESEPATVPQNHFDGEICVTQSKTFEAAMRLRKQFPDSRIAVLNFASAVHPGGGVKNGSSAQEESLCRCSTLYPTLDTEYLRENYYDVNREAKNVLHSDDCIYSPDIVICKTDALFPERLPEKEWYKVDVISCAAPNLRDRPANIHNPENAEAASISPQELTELHTQRAEKILSVAAANNAEILVLGAFGCGAFANDPTCVAKAYRDVLKTKRQLFRLVEFAVFCRPSETENFDAFSRELTDLH